MRLANTENAILPDRKFTEYLLNQDHPRGRSKARFLARFGFNLDELDVIRAALVAHAESNEIAGRHETSSGTRIEIDGPLPSPDGRAPVVRVVWFIEIGEDVPRLVTLVPRRIERL